MKCDGPAGGEHVCLSDEFNLNPCCWNLTPASVEVEIEFFLFSKETYFKK
jgi:hypothetical protein